MSNKLNELIVSQDVQLAYKMRSESGKLYYAIKPSHLTVDDAKNLACWILDQENQKGDGGE
jgi:hypothetical protein